MMTIYEFHKMNCEMLERERKERKIAQEKIKSQRIQVMEKYRIGDNILLADKSGSVLGSKRWIGNIIARLEDYSDYKVSINGNESFWINTGWNVILGRIIEREDNYTDRSITSNYEIR